MKISKTILLLDLTAMHFHRSKWLVLAALLGIFSNFVPPQWKIAVASSQMLAQTNEAQKAEAERLLNLCREHLSKNQAEAAIQSCQQAVTAHQQIKDRAGEAKSTVNLGIAYRSINQVERAVTTLQSGLELAIEANEQQVEAIALLNLCSGDYSQKAEEGIQFCQQAVMAYQSLKDLKIEGSVKIFLGLFYLKQRNYEQAIVAFQSALAIGRKTGERGLEAQALNTLGVAYYAQGKSPRAREFFQQALALARELKESQLEKDIQESLSLLEQTPRSSEIAEAEQFLYQGIQQFQTRQYPAAIESWQKASAIYREINDRNREAIALMGLGEAYRYLGQYLNAIEYFQQSLAIQKEIGDRNGEASSLGNLGNAYNSLGQYLNAIEYFQQSLAIFKEIGDRKGEANSIMGLGEAYDSLGQPSKAIEYFQQSLAIFKEIGDRQGEARSLNNFGTAYDSLGQYPKAIEYFQQSLAIFKEIGDHRGEASSVNNLGIVYGSLEQHSKAIEYFQQSLAIFKEIGDHRGEAPSINNFGLVYNSLGQYPKAIEYFQQSLAIFKEIGDRNGEANSIMALGNAYDSLGQYPKAIEYFQQSLAIFKETGNRQGEAFSFNNLGSAYIKLKQYAEAIKPLSLAIEVFESLRLNLNDPDKVSIFDIQAKSYRLLQQALIAQNQTNQALEISERGRARAFVELLASRLANNPNQFSIKPPTIQQIQQIAQQQNATLVEYSLTRDALYIWVIQPTGQITFHKTDLPSLNAPLTALVDASRQAIGVRAGGIAVQERLYRPGDLVKLKDDDKYGFKAPWQVIHYDPVNELLTLTNPQMNEGTQELPRSISDVLQKVSSARVSEKPLQELYQLLIKPIVSLLPTDPNKPVIFIPHGDLFIVPFTALQDEQGKYLIEKHTILTVPSIQVLELTRQQKNARRQEKLGKPLVMGNPTMPTVPLSDPPYKLAPLPSAEVEAKTIAQELGTQAILGDKATKATLIPQMEKAGIIHLATHGLLYEIKQLGTPGAIALAPTPTDNGFLTSGDIFEMKLKAELVVLSACNTGQGRITADGVIGLSRSFISAGVPSIIVSLWSVPDAPTAELMQKFYENKKTMNKAQALRQAMLDTMKTHPKPVDWAAFTLVGEAD